MRQYPKFEPCNLLMLIILSFFMIFASYSISNVSADNLSTEPQICESGIFYQESNSKIAKVQKHCLIMEEEKVNVTTSIIETVKDDLQISESENFTENVCNLPIISTNVKLFTDYRVYNLWYTPHYRLQQAAWTDTQGLRRYNEDYIVALGSFYSTDIGDRFEVTLDTGRTFTVILGDGKVDDDCDSENMYTPCIDYDGKTAANILEFIIDKNVLDSEVYSYGSIDYIEDFRGDIVKMVYLGRDTSQDWDLYE